MPRPIDSTNTSLAGQRGIEPGPGYTRVQKGEYWDIVGPQLHAPRGEWSGGGQSVNIEKLLKIFPLVFFSVSEFIYIKQWVGDSL